ncbi:DegT/DnrJ/EryC1/StrS family aminotransferase [Sulfurimonas sp. SWIR-19]|uniref:DegT/DnrJ/EryC1/StrS family aminotransferase n=1 Tax=Sulfurimonas sp. SWIR-19 TaxID=2878390 RepID=UPI001CF452F5|nr:DegT/DnrJ/EryC1/StrS family aminotransferase [Sulfurimonas sp. SWIR-19]UCN00483.1 DegT/DnrJ/EryC1/StrS family aminotransferase [Sulfurimonas sp. SWIR-19]
MNYELAYSTFGREEKQAMYDVIESDIFSMGKNVKAFEQEFAAFFGKKYAVMVNSGSSANLVAIAALFHKKNAPLKRGDEVIVPCISWATTFYPLQQYGLKLKFVDIEVDTLNYDITELKKAASEKTKLILTVSVLGNPNYYDAIETICEENNIMLFDDNCESMGAKYNGKYTGTSGIVNTFSTFFSHHISTMEGGLILTDDFEIYSLCKSLRNHGWTRDQDENSPIYEKKDDDFFEAYRFILPGYNVRPGELQGALGLQQIKKLPAMLEQRRKNAQYFQKKFVNDKRFIIQKEIGESSWFSFTMIINPKSHLKREDVFRALKKAKIGYRIITGGNFLEHDVIKYFDYEVTKSTNASYAHNNGFFVGNAPKDMTQEIDLLYTTLKDL